MNFLSIVWNIDPVICHIAPVITICASIIIFLVTVFHLWHKIKHHKKTDLFDYLFCAAFLVLIFLSPRFSPIPVRYYSLLFVAGFPLSCWIFAKIYRREGLKTEDIDPFLYAMLFGVVVGARLGHCIFYQPDYYFGSSQGFLEIFKPWKGGLASHGGAVGIICACLWYVRKYGRKLDIDLMWVFDRLTICICLCGGLIRIGNFFNSEIYGNPTDLPWGIIFARNGETVPKHPAQLYESLAYLIMFLLFALLYFKGIHRLKKGFMFGSFLILLFGFRFAVEFIKEPQVGFENGMAIDMGQILSIPFIIAGAVILWQSLKRGEPSLRTVRNNRYEKAHKS